MQWLVQQAAQRVFLVAAGELKLLEGGVAEYVKTLSGTGKKKAAAGGAKKGGSAAAAGSSSGTKGGGQKKPGGSQKR